MTAINSLSHVLALQDIYNRVSVSVLSYYNSSTKGKAQHNATVYTIISIILFLAICMISM